MSKIAIIDIDNTLWQFSDAFYLELKKINKNFPTPDQWCTYDIWEGYCSVEDFIAAISSIHNKQDTTNTNPIQNHGDSCHHSKSMVFTSSLPATVYRQQSYQPNDGSIGIGFHTMSFSFL